MERTVCTINQCTSCKACINVCPKNAILFRDRIKECNCLINTSLCVRCGACFEVCQVNNPPELMQPIEWHQGWAVSEDVRLSSSSGGFASAVMQKFLERKNASVFCCVFENGSFLFKEMISPNDLDKAKGSKYVKSDPLNVYLIIKDRLKKNRQVLFLGLPCQVGGMKNFIPQRYHDNLYTMDLICHGSPSVVLLDKFFQCYGLKLNEITSISFRSKNLFYINNNVKKIVERGTRDKYMFAFLRGLTFTENCYTCQYAQSKRVSDLSIGDSWGSELAKDEQRKGISLALCQTLKGKELLDQANLILKTVNPKKASDANQQLVHPFIRPKEREKFFSLLEEGKDFNTAVTMCYFKSIIKQDIKNLLLKHHIISAND